MTSRRLLGPVVLGLLAAGGAAWVAAGRTWASATVEVSGAPADEVAVTGAEALPLVPALAVVALTGALAVLATGGRARRVVGVVVTLVAVVALVLVVTGGDAVRSALDEAVRASPAHTGDNAPDVFVESAWRHVTGGLFVLVLLLGGLVVALGPTWPRMSGRYEAPGAPRRDSEADLWKAMDEGHDPTE